MEVTGKVIPPFATSDLSHLLPVPLFSPYETFKVFPTYLTCLAICLAGHFLAIFLLVHAEVHIPTHLPSLSYSGSPIIDN